MPEYKISDLTEADLPLDGTEDIEIVQDGMTKRCSSQDIANLAEEGTVFVFKMTVSSAEILALNTTPKQLVAAPGSGKTLQLIRFALRLNYNSSPYVGNQLQVLVNTIVACQTNLYTDSQNAFYTVSTNSTVGGDITAYENKAFFLKVNSADPTGGNSSIDVYLTYNVITL